MLYHQGRVTEQQMQQLDRLFDRIDQEHELFKERTKTNGVSPEKRNSGIQLGIVCFGTT